MSLPFFSIIVPFYNAAEFLKACLQSIYSQTFGDFEVLLINDGSNDESGQICQDLLAIDQRFHYYKLSNGGVSKARNFGINTSSGQYLLFVDSDDLLLPNALDIYHQAILYSSADIVKSGFNIVRYGVPEKRVIRQSILISGNNTQLMLEETEKSGYYGFLWNSIFKRETVGNLRFDESLPWLEDHIFSRQCFSRCSKMLLLNQITYCYYVRKRESLSHIQDPFIIVDASFKEYHSKANLCSEKSSEALAKSLQTLYDRLGVAISMSYKMKFSFRKRRLLNRQILCSLHRGKLRIRRFFSIYLHSVKKAYCILLKK